jgi:hypothetical protein
VRSGPEAALFPLRDGDTPRRFDEGFAGGVPGQHGHERFFSTSTLPTAFRQDSIGSSSSMSKNSGSSLRVSDPSHTCYFWTESMLSACVVVIGLSIQIIWEDLCVCT